MPSRLLFALVGLISFTLEIQAAAGLSYTIGTLKDSTGQLSVQAVVELDAEGVFSDRASFDKQTAVYWIKFEMAPLPEGTEAVVAKVPYFDSVLCYAPTADGRFIQTLSGDNIPFYQRPLPYTPYTGFLVALPDSLRTFYVRAVSASDFSMLLRSAKRLEVITAARHEVDTVKSRYFHGIFLGVLLAMIIYNLIIFFIYKDRSYASYSFYLITQVAYHLALTGFLSEFLFFNWPTLGKLAPYIIAGPSLIVYIYFAQTYLKSAELTPRWNRSFQVLYVLTAIVSFIGYFYRIDIANSMLLLISAAVATLAFIMSIIIYQKGYRPALYFIIATVLVFVSYLLFAMLGLRIIEDNFVVRYAFQITLAIQSLLFAMGLADRMRAIRRELSEKKLEAARLEKEQAEAIKKVLEEQNVMLETKVKERTKEIEQAHSNLAVEKDKSDRLLLNILPEEIAAELKEKGEAEARSFDLVTILFTDFQDFTHKSEKLSAAHLVEEINICFEAFDGIMGKYGIEKIKTIGDAYMAAGGIPVPTDVSVRNTVLAALDMQEFIAARYETRKSQGLEAFEMRVGIHSGPVVAGIVGVKKFQYDLWGDTVNTASRMESSGEVGKVNISQATYELLKGDETFVFENRGNFEVKGKGKMAMWYVSKKG